MSTDAIAHLNEGMLQYLTPEAAEFLEGVYSALNVDELKICGTCNENNKIDSIDDVFYALSYLVPESENVIKFLEKAAKHPKNSVLQEVHVSHVFKHAIGLTMLSKQYEQVFEFFNELDKRNVEYHHRLDGIGNATLAYADGVALLMKHKDDVLKTIDEFAKYDITVVSLPGNFSTNLGIFENPELLENIMNNSDNYFRGLTVLKESGAIGEYIHERKEWAKNGILWEYLARNNKCLIEIGKNQNFRELIESFLYDNKSNKQTILNYADRLLPYAEKSEKIKNFVREYNTIVDAHCTKAEHTNCACKIAFRIGGGNYNMAEFIRNKKMDKFIELVENPENFLTTLKRKIESGELVYSDLYHELYGAPQNEDQSCGD